MSSRHIFCHKNFSIIWKILIETMVETLKCTFGEKRRKLSRKVMPNSINGFLANQVFNAGKKLKIVLSNEKINLNRVDRNLNWSYSKKLWLRKKVSIVWTIVANGSIASLVLTRFHFDEPTLINRNAFYVWIFDSWRLDVTFSTKFSTKIKTSTNYWHFWPVRNSMSRAKTEILFCVHLFKKFFCSRRCWKNSRPLFMCSMSLKIDKVNS